MASDSHKIDAAVAAAEAKADQIEMVNIAGEFVDTRRPFALSVPADLIDAELGALVETIVRLKVKGEARKAEQSTRRPQFVDAMGGPLRPT